MLFTHNAEVSWLYFNGQALKKNAVFKNQIKQLNIIKFSDWDDKILNLHI